MGSSKRGRRRKQRRKRWINRLRVWWPVPFVVGFVVVPLYLLAASMIGYVGAFLLVLVVSGLGATVMGGVLLYAWAVESLTTKQRTRKSEGVVDEPPTYVGPYDREMPTPAWMTRSYESIPTYRNDPEQCPRASL